MFKEHNCGPGMEGSSNPVDKEGLDGRIVTNDKVGRAVGSFVPRSYQLC